MQQVRDLERLGVIPGRSIEQRIPFLHTAARACPARLSRISPALLGQITARHMLAKLRTETIAEAASAINAVHVRLAQGTEEALRARQRQLRAIQAEANTPEFEQE